jgi:hypothetical protein
MLFMETIDKVITLQQAQRLKELGIQQVGVTSNFWRFLKAINAPDSQYHWSVVNPTSWTEQDALMCAAFDATELGVMLPLDSQLYTRKNREGEWGVTYALRIKPVHAPTEAQARGEALIQLLESGYIRACEVNYRLTGVNVEKELVGTA